MFQTPHCIAYPKKQARTFTKYHWPLQREKGKKKKRTLADWFLSERKRTNTTHHCLFKFRLLLHAICRSFFISVFSSFELISHSCFCLICFHQQMPSTPGFVGYNPYSHQLIRGSKGGQAWTQASLWATGNTDLSNLYPNQWNGFPFKQSETMDTTWHKSQTPDT